MLNTIIAPVDGSEGSTKAVRFAGQLAKQTGAELILMYDHERHRSRPPHADTS